MKDIQKICEECGKSFTIENIKSNIKRRFCSGYCAKSNNGKRNRGRKFTDDINKKKR